MNGEEISAVPNAIERVHPVPEFKRKSNSIFNPISSSLDIPNEHIKVLIVDDNAFNIMGLQSIL